MELSIKRHPVIDYLLIIIGSSLVALAVNQFYDPLGMVPGGVSGLAIIIKEVTGFLVPGGIPLYLSNFVINIPLFIGALLIKGHTFGGRSVFATFFLSFALYYTKFFPTITTDVFLAVVFGGIMSGAGLGLVFLAQSSTGGTDILAAILNHFFKHLSIATNLFLIDAGIVLVGIFVFGVEQAMYSVLVIYITTKILDYMLEGLHFSKAALIISDQNQAIAEQIISELDRGVTGLAGEGKYTGLPKQVLLCIVSRRQIFRVKEIVQQHDRHAFFIVTDVREVMGEGFIEYVEKEKTSMTS